MTFVNYYLIELVIGDKDFELAYGGRGDEKVLASLEELIRENAGVPGR